LHIDAKDYTVEVIFLHDRLTKHLLIANIKAANYANKSRFSLPKQI